MQLLVAVNEAITLHQTGEVILIIFMLIVIGVGALFFALFGPHQ
jgi:hypothetical protein